MSKKRTKVLCVHMAIILITSMLYANVSASDLRAEEMSINHRIVFLLNASGSMMNEDPSSVMTELPRVFIDLLQTSNVQVGFAAFNNDIIKSRPVTSIESQANRESIKSEIAEISMGGWTDKGKALLYAVELLMNDGLHIPDSEDTRHSIVFITDGLRSNTLVSGRTLEDSFDDETTAIEMAVSNNIPIHIVQTNAAGQFDLEHNMNIASETSGSWHEVNNINQIPTLLERLFADVVGVIPQIHAVTATGEPQSVDLHIPYVHTGQSNVIIWHNGVLQGNQNQGAANIAIGNTLLYQSNLFGSTRLDNPSTDNLTINFVATYGSEISFIVANHFDVFPVASITESADTNSVEVYAVLHRQGDLIPLTNQRYYDRIVARLIVTDLLTGHTKTIPMTNMGSSFTAVMENISSGEKEFKVFVEAGSFNGMSLGQVITLGGALPRAIPHNIPARILMRNEYLVIDLNDIFYDPNGTISSFEILDATNEVLEMPERILLQDNILTIYMGTRGNENFLVRALYGVDGVAMYHIAFEVLPFWLYHGFAILIITIIFLILLCGYLLFTRHTKSAPIGHATYVQPLPASTTKFANSKFEGYFLNTMSGDEIPILNWSASYIEGKDSVSLGELFFSKSDIREKLPEAYKMHFEASKNQTVVFQHDTDCVVSVGGKDVPRGKKEVLHYDSKMYIVFEDLTTEVEIRYKRMRRTTRT